MWMFLYCVDVFVLCGYYGIKVDTGITILNLRLLEVWFIIVLVQNYLVFKLMFQGLHAM